MSFGNGITLRKAKKEDCLDLFRWINDPDTRAASLNSRSIPYKEHLSWFKISLNSKNRFIYIALNGAGEKIGVVRLDLKGGLAAEIHLNIAPESRCKGYGSRVISDACKELHKRKAISVFIARIKSNNMASVAAFKKAGFFETFDYEYGKKNSILVFLNYLER